MGDLQILSETTDRLSKSFIEKLPGKTPVHTPSSIIFVRNRMMYARGALNAQGGIRFGLRHIRTSYLYVV